MANKSLTVAPKICGASTWNLLHVTILAPELVRYLWYLEKFCKSVLCFVTLAFRNAGTNLASNSSEQRMLIVKVFFERESFMLSANYGQHFFIFGIPSAHNTTIMNLVHNNLHPLTSLSFCFHEFHYSIRHLFSFTSNNTLQNISHVNSSVKFSYEAHYTDCWGSNTKVYMSKISAYFDVTSTSKISY
jgi:hypothetical protein